MDQWLQRKSLNPKVMNSNPEANNFFCLVTVFSAALLGHSFFKLAKWRGGKMKLLNRKACLPK